ncbi:MAG: hypothetical protein AAF219_04130 [Myxococcota bacterium]
MATRVSTGSKSRTIELRSLAKNRQHTAPNRQGHLLHSRLARSAELEEGARLERAPYLIDPIEKETVKVHVQSQAGVRTLDEGDRAGLKPLDAVEPVKPLRTKAQVASDLVDHAVQNLRAQRRIEGHAIAKLYWNGQHPLADGHMGHD